MKKIKSCGNFNIYEVTDKDRKNGYSHDNKYLLISKEEAAFPEYMREVEWDSDNIQELLDFVNPKMGKEEFGKKWGITE